MNDRASVLFEKYGMVGTAYKGRGCLILQRETEKVALVPYQGKEEHLRFEKSFLEGLSAKEATVERIYETTEGELLCSDYEGQPYFVKTYLEGNECNVTNQEECQRVMEALAHLHKALRENNLPEDVFVYESGDDLLADFDKRTKELIRARGYMRKVAHKDPFEMAFLQVYDIFWQQVEKAMEYLPEALLQTLAQKQVAENMFTHGEVTQHNAIWIGNQVVFRNFEKVGPHLQVKDVYLFMRKALEKNNWCPKLAEVMLRAYTKVLPLSQEEYSYLYARFQYPEKYWKIANSYLNKRKTMPLRRAMEKLEALMEKEEQRAYFLQSWEKITRQPKIVSSFL